MDIKKKPDWDKIRGKQITNCQNCKSRKSYTNPLWKCFECEGRFCADCISVGMVNDEMGMNERARDVCDKCKKEYKYFIL